MDHRTESMVSEIVGFMHVHLEAMFEIHEKGLSNFIAAQGAKAALEENFREKTRRCIESWCHAQDGGGDVSDT